MQVHAACSGAWGFRASSGIGLADSKGAVAGSLEAVGWACQNPRDLQLVGEALKVPGSELPHTPARLHHIRSVLPFYTDRSINSACPDICGLTVAHNT